MSKQLAGAASQLEWDNGDFEEDMDDPSEFEENESKAPQIPKKQGDRCKICHRNFPNLFIHLSRWSTNCRNEYGQEFEEIKKRKHDEQKAKKRKLNNDSYEINKDAIKKKKA